MNQNGSTPIDEEYDGPETKGWWKIVSCIPLSMRGKLAVVTGSNSGIGLAVTGELARRGANVIMACRDITRGQAAKDQLLALYGSENPDSVRIDVADPKITEVLQPIEDQQLRLEQVDLSSLESVRSFADRLIKANKPIHYLVNNAGVLTQTCERSADDYEMQMAVNYLAPVLLTELLLPLLRLASPKGARIVNISSMLHFTGDLYKPDFEIPPNEYGPYVAYSQSKLALTMYTTQLAKRLKDSTVTVVALNPGHVDSDLGRSMNTWTHKLLNAFMQPQKIKPWDAAQQVVHALLRKNPLSGAYYDNYERVLPDRLAMTPSETEWLWNKTRTMLNLNE